MKKIILNIHKSIMHLNNSKFFSGLIMLLMNVGSKYITIKFSKTQEQLIKNSFAREVLIFAIVWMGTHDIYMSIMMTAAFIILADYILNEKSKFCMLPAKYKYLNKIIDENDDGFISNVEIKKAEDVLRKAKKQKHKLNQMEMMSYMNN